MHGRHRNPAANGYNRFGPEGSGRTRGFHGSGNRFGGRGFGRGQGHFRPFRSGPQPSPRKGGDIFVEAGKMAAEYLVLKGVLSPDFREFRGDGVQVQLDGRVSAHSRLGSVGFDPGFGRRRYGEDYSPRGTRNHWKGKRRSGSFRGYGSDWGREYGRNSVSSERSKGSPDNEGWDGVASGRDKELQVEEDNEDVSMKSVQDELALKADSSVSKGEKDALTDEVDLKEAGVSESNKERDALTAEKVLKEASGSESKIEKDALADEMALKGSFSCAEKDGRNEADDGIGKDFTTLNVNAEELIDNTVSDEIKKEKAEEDLSVDYSAAEGSNSANSCANLLAFCNPMKVPTRIRSSLASRILKVGSVSSSEDELKSNIQSQEYGFAQGSFGDSPSHTSPSTKGFESDAKKPMSVDSLDEKEMSAAHGVEASLDADALSEQSAQDAGNTELAYSLEQDKCARSFSSLLGVTSLGRPAECVKESSPVFVVEQSKCFGSNSFPEKDAFHPVGQESSHSSHSCAAIQEIAEKRPLEDSDMNVGTKKFKEWLPAVTTRTEDHLHLIEKIGCSKEEGNSAQIELPVDVTQEGLANISQFPKHGGESCAEYAQEKQLFPDSLHYNANIMDTSDRSGSHHNDPSQLYPSISGSLEEMPIDIDLSMSSNISSQYSSHLTNVKEIEVIDLEDDPLPEEKADNNAERMRETVLTGLGAYSNHPQSSGVITDVQDNYDGLMISDYFNSFQNCAPAPAEINHLTNEMGIPNGEVTLGDDDSIYMSLDEIPLGFLRAWEQPPSEEYDKNF